MKRISIINILPLFVFFYTTFMLSSCGGADARPASSSSSSGSKTEAYKLGFIPLTDCASIVMAKELGLF